MLENNDLRFQRLFQISVTLLKSAFLLYTSFVVGTQKIAKYLKMSYGN